MPLEPQSAAAIAMLNQLPSIMSTPLVLLRNMPMPGVGEPTALAEIRPVAIPAPHGTLPARLYRSSVGTLGLLVYFHGGGFVLGGLESHDEVCRRLAKEADCAVLAVDYRLAPEHKFPAAPEDALTATRWAMAHAGELGADARRIVIGGDSAGGNLAAVTALRLRDEDGPALCGQLLIYPATTAHDVAVGSLLENGEGYFLTRELLEWFSRQYMPDPAMLRHPHFAVLSTPDLSRLPPAHVVTAEFDPLRDEGEAYARKLRAAGVTVNAIRYDGTFHGFFALPNLDIGALALTNAARWLCEAFAGELAR